MKQNFKIWEILNLLILKGKKKQQQNTTKQKNNNLVWERTWRMWPSLIRIWTGCLNRSQKLLIKTVGRLVRHLNGSQRHGRMTLEAFQRSLGASTLVTGREMKSLWGRKNWKEGLPRLGSASHCGLHSLCSSTTLINHTSTIPAGTIPKDGATGSYWHTTIADDWQQWGHHREPPVRQ